MVSWLVVSHRWARPCAALRVPQTQIKLQNACTSSSVVLQQQWEHKLSISPMPPWHKEQAVAAIVICYFQA